MKKSTHEKHLSQPLQAFRKQFKIVITFLTGYNGLFEVTDKNNKFYFAKSITDNDGFIRIILLEGACELELLNDEIKRIITDECQFTKADYSFTIKFNFSFLGIIIEIFRQEPLNSFLPVESIWNLLGFNSSTIYEEMNVSPNPFEIFFFDNVSSNVISLKEWFLKVNDLE